jgi:fatty acid synthase
MGIQDKKSVSMDSTLTQLGIDSLTGVEIQQIIEHEFDISLTSQEIRSLTLNQLEKRVLSKDSKHVENPVEDSTTAAEKVEWMKLLMEGVVDPKTMELTSSDIVVHLNNAQASNTKILIIPGFFGWASKVYQQLGHEMEFPAYVLQYMNTNESENVDEIVNEIIPSVLEIFSDVENFILIGHSFGAILCLKIAKIFEDLGKSGKIIQIDGSPMYSNKSALLALDEYNFEQDTESYISMILFKFYQQFVDSSISKAAFDSDSNWPNRFKQMTLLAGDVIPLTHEYMMTKVSSSYVNRLNIAINIQNEEFPTLKSTKISLIKPLKITIKDLPNDYGLSQYSSHDVIIQHVSGDHVTMLQNLDLPLVIKQIISD